MTRSADTPSFEQLLPGLRERFPALSRKLRDQSVIYLDGPAGSQVPESVIDSIGLYYRNHNANRSGHFASSHETDQLMDDAHSAAAALFGTSDPTETIFGANMTSLTFSFSRALARSWTPGDEVVVTQLDHDANITPWRMAAEDRGASVRVAKVRTADATLDLDDFASQINERTRLVAVTCASNSVGSRTPIEQLIQIAHDHGAEVYLDAVHFAPHSRIDVVNWHADYVVCSGYKFFGPHVGLLWGRKDRLEALQAYKVRPAPEHAPGKWMTGTQNHAALCGLTAAIDYLCLIGRLVSGDAIADRRKALDAAFQAVEGYECQLVGRLLEGLKQIPRVTVFGITEQSRLRERVPTVALSVEGRPSADVAAHLGERGVFCWHGNYYAVDVCNVLGMSEHGMVRLGLMHTNTEEEVDRTLEALSTIA